MDLTNQLGLMRALPQRCSVIASSDRMLISAIAQLFDGVGPLVGAPINSTRAAARRWWPPRNNAIHRSVA